MCMTVTVKLCKAVVPDLGLPKQIAVCEQTNSGAKPKGDLIVAMSCNTLHHCTV